MKRHTIIPALLALGLLPASAWAQDAQAVIAEAAKTMGVTPSLDSVTYIGAGTSFALGQSVSVNGLSPARSNLSDYRRTVCELAADPQRRQHLRQVLQQAREQAPLFDSPRYVRALDDLFERIVLRHRAGLPPEYLPAMPA